MKWEYITFQIRKIRAKNTRRIKNDLEKKFKDLENDLKNDDELQKYNEIKSELEKIYEKSTKFFLNLERKRALQGQNRKLIIGNQEIVNQNKIQNEHQIFYRNLFKSTVQNHMIIVSSF